MYHVFYIIIKFQYNARSYYADSDGFLGVNGHNDEIRHFQLWEIYQGARCILAESGSLNSMLYESTKHRTNESSRHHPQK